MIRLRENSWHAKLYKMTNGSELPSDFCSYFLCVILMLFTFVCIGVSIIMLGSMLIFLPLLRFILLTLIIIFGMARLFGNVEIKLKRPDLVWWSNTKEVVKGWKEKYCPLIKWEGKSNGT